MQFNAGAVAGVKAERPQRASTKANDVEAQEDWPAIGGRKCRMQFWRGRGVVACGGAV